MRDENLPPRFTPKDLESLAMLANQFAYHYIPVETADQYKMLEISKALQEAAKVAQLHENLAFVLMQVGLRAQQTPEVRDQHLSEGLEGPSPGWCVECGAEQFNTRGGVTCPNGHGGAETLTQRPRRWP